jgi:hypothetical protein
LQKERAPPFVRIRIQGIDRAKKELGIKMDCQVREQDGRISACC